MGLGQARICSARARQQPGHHQPLASARRREYWRADRGGFAHLLLALRPDGLGHFAARPHLRMRLRRWSFFWLRAHVVPSGDGGAAQAELGALPGTPKRLFSGTVFLFVSGCAAAADGWWCWRLELQGEVLRQSQGHQEPSGLAAGTGRALSTNHQHTAKHKPGRLICSLLSLVLRSGTRASPKTRCKPTVRKPFFDFHFLSFAQL